MRDFYKTLIRLRKQHPALTQGDYTLLTQPQDAALAFARRDAASGDQVVVVANRDDQAVAIDVAAPPNWPAQPALDRLSGETVNAAAGRIKLEMAPKSVRIITPASN